MAHPWLISCFLAFENHDFVGLDQLRRVLEAGVVVVDGLVDRLASMAFWLSYAQLMTWKLFGRLQTWKCQKGF